VDVTEALNKMFTLCVLVGFNIFTVWRPRDLLEAEDLLSRQPNASDCGIVRSMFETICDEFKVKVAIDLFASDS
jgi:hypothetical protein